MKKNDPRGTGKTFRKNDRWLDEMVITQSRKGKALIPMDLLDRVISYIERTEETLDGFNACRSLKKLIKEKAMPKEYNELLTLKKQHGSNSN